MIKKQTLGEWFFIAVAALALFACGAKTADQSSESNTNWLRACDDDAQCGGELACYCGVCTRNCEEESCPGELTCVDACGSSVASCQAECQDDADCAFLAPDAECRGSVCAIDGQGLSAHRIASATRPDAGTAVQGQPELTDEQFERAIVTSGTAGHADTTGAAWRLIEVPALYPHPRLVHTPRGWVTFLSRYKEGRVQGYSIVESALSHSSDGVHWDLLPPDPSYADAWLIDLAYGADRYVMIGERMGTGLIWSSSNGEDWTEVEQVSLDPVSLWRVAFAGQHFFVFGTEYLGISEDGVTWTRVPISRTTVFTTAAYGHGRYLLVGGRMWTSEDALVWQAHDDEDCELPGSCSTHLDGTVYRDVRNYAQFAEGRFFIDQASSIDGVNWEPLLGRYPVAYLQGRFLGNLSLSFGLPVWTPDGEVETLRVVRPVREAVTQAGRATVGILDLDQEAPLPARVNVEFDDGLTCETATCVVVDNRLLLIPPPGTAPLPDRVPRGADGAPLLSDECPVSSQIFCQDYEQRTGCTCEPMAPRSPEDCDDVSQYQCEGRFLPRDHEWVVDEVAHAGCDCGAVDPNQPPSFATSCAEGSDTCIEPFECLEVEVTYRNTRDLLFIAAPKYVCTTPCAMDADCPTWEATGFCAGPVQLRCTWRGSCQPRDCQ